MAASFKIDFHKIKYLHVRLVCNRGERLSQKLSSSEIFCMLAFFNISLTAIGERQIKPEI
jgi:hypothetical protein